MDKDVELELIEEEELLAGLLSLTSGNLGAAYSLVGEDKEGNGEGYQSRLKTGTHTVVRPSDQRKRQASFVTKI